MGSKTRQESRRRLASQAQVYLKDPQRKRANPVGEIGVTSSAIFRRIGTRQYPLYIHRQAAPDLRDPWNIVSIRRMDFNHCELAPQADRPHNVYATLRMFWLAVERNIDRFRGR